METHQENTSSSSLAQPLPGNTQPHETNLRQRRVRKPLSLDNDITPSSDRKTISQSRLSPLIQTDSSERLGSELRDRPSTKMPSSDTSSLSGLASPRFTKTGRVSKAKKGLRGAHICTCGKVSLASSLFGASVASTSPTAQYCTQCKSRVVGLPHHTLHPSSKS